jgi:hypothetical protein
MLGSLPQSNKAICVGCQPGLPSVVHSDTEYGGRSNRGETGLFVFVYVGCCLPIGFSF